MVPRVYPLPRSCVPLKLPTQPLPPPPSLQQVPQQQQAQAKQPATNLDVLAQSLISADLDFDFEPAEPVRMGGGSSLIPPSETQVIKMKLCLLFTKTMASPLDCR